MKTDCKIVFLGTPDFSVKPLSALVENGYDVIAVVCNPDKPVGRKQILTAPPVKIFAEKNGISVYQYKCIRKEGVEDMKALAPDLMITCAFGQILSQEILDIPRLGVYNVHGSLLPKYRGASPVQSAILAGEKETGVTIMKTDVGVDTGDMLLSRSIQIGRETADELFEKLSVLGAEALLSAMPEICGGSPALIPQKEEEATHTAMLKKEDAEIDWNGSAEKIDCFIRALCGWPVAFTKYRGEPVKIYYGTPTEGKGKPGEILSVNKEGVTVACHSGALRVEKLQFPGGKVLSASEVKSGGKILSGSFFG